MSNPEFFFSKLTLIRAACCVNINLIERPGLIGLSWSVLGMLPPGGPAVQMLKVTHSLDQCLIISTGICKTFHNSHVTYHISGGEFRLNLHESPGGWFGQNGLWAPPGGWFGHTGVRARTPWWSILADWPRSTPWCPIWAHWPGSAPWWPI